MDPSILALRFYYTCKGDQDLGVSLQSYPLIVTGQVTGQIIKSPVAYKISGDQKYTSPYITNSLACARVRVCLHQTSRLCAQEVGQPVVISVRTR